MSESTLRKRRAVSTLSRPFAKVEPEEATALSTSVFASINLSFTLVWLWLVVLVGREHRQREIEIEEQGEQPAELAAEAT